MEDRLAVRRLVAEVVAEYDERVLTSTLPPLSDMSSTARSVFDAVAGYGPPQRHLDDPEIEEIRVHERQAHGCRQAHGNMALDPWALGPGGRAEPPYPIQPLVRACARAA